ncbi:MAG: hypothetical protein H6672_09940 [Anaerolineaceae bacterium]|nr:hypothetical protein [Anaerolineaceae bacterium]
MITLLIHIANSEPLKIDVEELPNPGDVMIVGKNPRDRKDREAEWLDEGVTTVMFPWSRINLIQVLPDPDEQQEFPQLWRTD